MDSSEANNTPGERPAQQQPQPGMPPRLSHPISRRPMVDGLVPRRPAMPGAPSSQLARPLGSLAPQHPAQPHHVSHPQAPRPIAVHSAPAGPTPHAAATPAQHPQPAHHQAQTRDFVPAVADDMDSTSNTKAPRERNQTGHSGLVGFVVFVLLTALLVAPVVPGKILANFPLSSQSFSTGDEALDCVGTQGQISNSTKYTSKAGAPLTYTYATATSQSATCNGRNQSAVTGHASQFSPLALVVDVVVALVVAVVMAKIWKRIFGEKPHKASKR